MTNMSNEEKFLARRIVSLKDRVRVANEILDAVLSKSEPISVVIDALRFVAESEDALAKTEFEALLDFDPFPDYREKAS